MENEKQISEFEKDYEEELHSYLTDSEKKFMKVRFRINKSFDDSTSFAVSVSKALRKIGYVCTSIARPNKDQCLSYYEKKIQHKHILINMTIDRHMFGQIGFGKSIITLRIGVVKH